MTGTASYRGKLSVRTSNLQGEKLSSRDAWFNRMCLVDVDSVAVITSVTDKKPCSSCLAPIVCWRMAVVLR